MPSYNRIILAGHLTRDPELTYTQGNVGICKFGLAVNHRRKDKDGNQKDEVCFVDCVAFGKQGEVVNQYLRKGSAFMVEGRLSFRTWETKEGKKASKHEVVVEGFTFLGKGNSAEPDNAPQPSAVTAASTPHDDDIPF